MISRRDFVSSMPLIGGAIASYGTDNRTYSKDPYIKVDTYRHELSFHNGSEVRRYPAFFGPNEEDKIVVKDRATPKGNFYICQKSAGPLPRGFGSRWMRLSYPSFEDAERGLRTGLITENQYLSIVHALERGKIPLQTTKLGGGIGIHGTPDRTQKFYSLYRQMHDKLSLIAPMISNMFDNTHGCVALFNADVEELFDLSPIGTKVEIL